MTPWYVYLGATVAIVSLIGTAWAIARRLIRFGRRLVESVDRAADVLEHWPAISETVAEHAALLVELPLALGRVDGAQRRNHESLDELWRRWRDRYPDDPERPI